MEPTPTPALSRILVVDDTVAIHEDFRKILKSPAAPAPLLTAQERLFGTSTRPPRITPSFDVDCVAQGRDAFEQVKLAAQSGHPYAVAFVDMRMPPGWDGIETIRHLWSVDPTLQVVICTAYSDQTWADVVAELGASDNLLILKKPFDNIEVLQVTHALSAKWAVSRKVREQIATLDERVRQQALDLRQAEGHFTAVFEANPVPTTLQVLSTGRYTDANPAFLALIGSTSDQVIGRTPAELKLWPDSDIWAASVASLSSGMPFRSHTTRLRTATGEIREVLIWVASVRTGPETRVLTSIEDATDRMLLQRKFQHSQKMEAVGQLAAGIAHDFNNLLTVIQSYTELVLEDQHLSPTNRDGLGQVQAAAARAAALTRQLLVFSRRQISHPKPLHLVATLDQIKAMLRRLIPEHIAIDWYCDRRLPPVLADEANLEQVIMNLFVNARDAIAGDGRISMHVARESLDGTGARRHPDAKPGEYVRMTVADTGHGMSPEVQSRIFEPFFTTKEVGHGTGLGLSTVYAIVRQHSGWVEVTSTPGKGSEFSVFLPSLPETHEPAPVSVDDPLGNAALHGHGEKILVVEDEPTVRFAVREIARRAGYAVTDAVDAPSALEIWNTSPTFDLLFTDVVMPGGTTGIQLAALLRAQRPGLKVIITTGYSRDLLQQKNAAIPGAELLLKPFTTADLLMVLRKALDGE